MVDVHSKHAKNPLVSRFFRLILLSPALNLNQNELSVFWNGIEVGLGLLRDFFKVFYYIWDGEVTGGGVILSAWLSFGLSFLSGGGVILHFMLS
jgi:hypothetical protein